MASLSVLNPSNTKADRDSSVLENNFLPAYAMPGWVILGLSQPLLAMV